MPPGSALPSLLAQSSLPKHNKLTCNRCNSATGITDSTSTTSMGTTITEQQRGRYYRHWPDVRKSSWFTSLLRLVLFGIIIDCHGAFDLTTHRYHHSRHHHNDHDNHNSHLNKQFGHDNLHSLSQQPWPAPTGQILRLARNLIKPIGEDMMQVKRKQHHIDQCI